MGDGGAAREATKEWTRSEKGTDEGKDKEGRENMQNWQGGERGDRAKGIRGGKEGGMEGEVDRSIQAMELRSGRAWTV